MTDNVNLSEKLKHYFGFDSFKGDQEAIIRSLMAGHNVFVLMPTGGGKSLCYQLPSLLMEGTAIVVSPLIALMKNQVDAVNGISEHNGLAHYLNSSLTKAQTTQVMNDVRNGQTKLLYVAPESLNKPENLEFFKSFKISFYAIDEAHCISEWGHDFRPEYRNLRPTINKIGNAPVIALTATATDKVRSDIKKNLEIQDAIEYKSSFNRPNLYYEVRPKTKEINKQIVLFIKKHPGKSGIIYCLSRKTVEELAAELKANDIKAAPYHAGLDSATRSQTQDDFLMERIDVIVATIAFGMGIDKPDVRSVIHYNMPKDLESYYQEAGRAGRDGAPASAVLLFSPQDILLNARRVEESQAPNAKENLQAMTSYCNTGGCLRRYILRYFGEEPAWRECGNCSVCDGTVAVHDCTVEAQKILSCIIRMGQRYGAGKVSDVLRASDTEFNRAHHFERLSTYGVMKEYSDRDIRDIISLLVAEGYLVIDEFRTLKATERSKALLHGEETIAINKQLKEEGRRRLSQRVEDIESYDAGLFQTLRILRRQIAENTGVAPFVIFSDRSLIDMAAKLPQDMGEMRDIAGVGEKKLARYGEPFMLAVRAYVSQHGIDVAAARRQNLRVTAAPQSVSGKGAKRSTQVRTLEMIRQGMQLEAIARTRKLTLQTIESHVLTLLEQGQRLPVEKWLSDDDRAFICRTAKASQSDRLTPIKDALPDRISFFQIKLALTLEKFGQ